MDSSIFHFKQFSVKQEKSGLKIGTDAVILGALSEVNPNVELILDVGTGTGVIALMVAQKINNNSKIIGVEINKSAAQEATENFLNSKWNLNLTCLNISFQEFSKHYYKNIDLILSNPPYFNNSLKSKTAEKSTAKHTNELNFYELIENSSQLLSPEGELHVIIPANEFENFCSIANKNRLFVKKIVWIKSTELSKIIRAVIFFSIVNSIKTERTIVIRNSEDNNYTDQYKILTKEYYLNL
jgi:tRNA1Val (adenine37-N6)-methyltransferase